MSYKIWGFSAIWGLQKMHFQKLLLKMISKNYHAKIILKIQPNIIVSELICCLFGYGEHDTFAQTHICCIFEYVKFVETLN